MHIAVLGCGPSGLLAAHAAREQGCAVTLISIKEKSPILGGQYLHCAVPGFTGKADRVTYATIGEAEGYSMKVYGKPDIPCFEHEGEYPAWSLTEAYDNLWGCWGSMIRDYKVEPDDIAGLCSTYDLILCTLPRNVMCYRPSEHMFLRQRIEVFQGGSLLGKSIENLVLYSGRSRDAWYRTSNLFGHETTEWSTAGSEGERHPVMGASVEVKTGIKPLGTDCDCHDEHRNFYRLGRFGKWGHGILVSDALAEAREIISEQIAWER